MGPAEYLLGRIRFSPEFEETYRMIFQSPSGAFHSNVSVSGLKNWETTWILLVSARLFPSGIARTAISSEYTGLPSSLYSIKRFLPLGSTSGISGKGILIAVFPPPCKEIFDW